MEMMEKSCQTCEISAVCLVHTGFYLLPNVNRELESCAMGSCEKYITLAQPLILEAYLKKKTGIFTLLKIITQQSLGAVK